jgi:DNA-binding transcriptional LysR family regulator
MNIVQLRAFAAVVEHGSFSEAARVLDISQPAVTMQIQALEADLGVTLFDRRYRGTEPTEPGRTLLPYATRILSALGDARSALDALSDRVTGRLIVAASTTPGQYVLPRLLGSFVREYPEVGVSLRVHDSAEVVAAVESGEASIGMTGARVAGAKADFEALGADSLILVCPPDGPLAGRSGLTLAEVLEQPFIIREPGSGTRVVFEDALRAAGADPADLLVITELSTSEAIVNAVEGGMGVGVVSRWTAEKAVLVGSVAELDVEGFPVARPFYLVMARIAPTRATLAFAEHLRIAL